MRARSRFPIVLAALLALVGCANQARLKVTTEPIGGYITEVGTGRTYGTAPVHVNYDAVTLQSFTDSSGCFVVKGMESRWVSGAVTRMDPIRLCGSATDFYEVKLMRNAAQPGLDQDLAFALQIRSAAAQKQAADAASTAAAAAFLESQRVRNAPAATATSGGFLKRQYESGFNRICVYDRLGSDVAITIGVTQLCPLSSP